MSALGNLLRAEAGVPRKYGLNVIPGDSAPKAIHADGVTHWKNRKPMSYTRAFNELQVGQLWLEREFPATFALHKLNGGVRLPERVLPYELEWRQWIGKHKALALQCVSPVRERSLDVEEDRRLYAD